MPQKPEREYRSMELLAVKTDGRHLESDHYVEGYATTYGTPYLLAEIDGIKYFERVDPRALVGADLSDVIMQFDHRGHVYARNKNGTLYLDPSDPHGLLIAADLSKTTNARNMYEEIATGLVTRMSWGFVVAEDSYDRTTHTRTILKIRKVYDVSAVSIPANPDTVISARSWLDGVIEAARMEDVARRKQRLRIICNT